MGALSEVSPVPAETEFSPDSVVVDLVYGRQTPLLKQSADQGCRTFDGLEMLVQQGARAFRTWTGLEPNVDVMRQACRSHRKEGA
jgi:shikimate dehydrogenase